ncbi:PAS domain-containing protein [Methanoregula sp.]|uniref:PAS domain-containing protein n=1 Tax=Methanoregula sp. TaxID=2052170 RepID=UPI003565CF55
MDNSAMAERVTHLEAMADSLNELLAVQEKVVAEQSERLKENDALLKSILMGSPALQFVIDKDHRVISWNKALEEYSGIKETTALGTRNQWMPFYDAERPVLADLLIDETIEQLPEWYQGKINNSRFVAGAFEATDFFPKMGTSGTWLYFTAAPIRNAKGAIIGAVETLVDITERKQSENALKESNDRFLAFIKEAAMRLKNPMEVVEQNISIVIEDIERGQFENCDVLLQLKIQIRNLEQIRQNIIELNKMIVNHSGDLSESSKKFLTE